MCCLGISSQIKCSSLISLMSRAWTALIIGLFQMFLLKLWNESGIENIGPICYTRLIFRPAIGAYYIMIAGVNPNLAIPTQCKITT